MDQLYKTMLQRLLENIKMKEASHRGDDTIMTALQIAKAEIERLLREEKHDR